MKLLTVFRKSMKEQLREPWMLGLTLAFAPFFVFLYALFFANYSTTYTVLMINQDRGVTLDDGSTLDAGQGVIDTLNAMTYPDGKPMVTVRLVGDQAEAEALLRRRDGTLFVILPEDFSRTIRVLSEGNRDVTTGITFGGDMTSTQYAVGVAVALTAADAYVQQMTGQQPLIGYTEIALGGTDQRSEFEFYVPGVLIFAVILLIFQASMVVAREIESGTLRRLQITRLTTWQYLGGVTLSLIVVGVVSVLLTFAGGLAVGFHSQGPLWVAVLVGAIASLSIIGVGMIVASFAKTVSQAFIIANFPLGLFMFFSGSIFPIGSIPLFEIAGHTVGLFDILPPTHAVAALNKVLTLGAGLGDVAWELGALVVLSVLYFAVGVWLFRRMHMRAA